MPTEYIDEINTIEKLINRSKDTNIIYLTKDTILNTKAVQMLANYIERLQKENALNSEKTVHTCLHCGNDTPLYCEKCYQELISKNAELQLENNQLKRKIFDLYNSSGEYEKAKCIMTKELRDYIPKQAIRDKIQELKAKYNLGDDYWQYDYDVDMNTIDILEELSRE